MRNLFIGLIVLALLAGVLTKTSSNQTSLISQFLNLIGVSTKEKKSQEELKDLLDESDKQNQTYAEYLRNQKAYLTYSKDQMSGLSAVISNISDHDSKFDVLRIKDLMSKFQDQNSLLIENGDKLLEENERQLKINQDLKRKIEANIIKSNDRQKELLESLKHNLSAQKEHINQQFQKTRELNDQLKNLKEEAKQKQIDSLLNKNSKFSDTIESLSSKTDSFIQQTKEKQDQLRNIEEQNSLKLENVKDKIQRLKDRQESGALQNNSLDRSRELNDHIKEQMQRLKDQRK